MEAASWRQNLREAGEALQAARDGDAAALETARIKVEAARIAAEAEGPEAQREAEAFAAYDLGLLALLQGDAQEARGHLLGVEGAPSKRLEANARYNLSAMEFAEAANRHQEASELFEAMAPQMLQMAQENGQEIPATLQQGLPEAEAPQLSDDLLQIASALGSEAPATMLPSQNAPSNISQQEGADPGAVIEGQLNASVQAYDNVINELRQVLREGSGDDTDARRNYELAKRGKENAMEVLNAWRQLQQLNAPQDQQQQQNQQQNEEQEEGEGEEAEQQQSQSGGEDEEPTEGEQGEQDQAREDSQRQAGEQDQPPSGEQRQDSEAETSEQSEEQEEQNPEDKPGEGEERQQEDQQGEFDENDGTSQGEQSSPQMGDPQTAEQEPLQEPEQLSEREGSEQQQDPIDLGPDRGVREEQMELDEDGEAAPFEQTEEEGTTPASEGGDQQEVAPATPGEGMSPTDARLFLQQVDEDKSKLGRRSFLRSFRRQSQRESEKAW